MSVETQEPMPNDIPLRWRSLQKTHAQVEPKEEGTLTYIDDLSKEFSLDPSFKKRRFQRAPVSASPLWDWDTLPKVTPDTNPPIPSKSEKSSFYARLRSKLRRNQKDSSS